MSIRYRLAAMCVIVALLPAIPLSILVSNLLEKSFDVGLSETMEDALDSGMTVSRKHLEMIHAAFERETAGAVARLGRALPDSARVAALLSDPAAPGSIDGFFLSEAGPTAPEGGGSPLPDELEPYRAHLSAAGLLANTVIVERRESGSRIPGLKYYETENRAAQLALWQPGGSTTSCLFYERVNPEFMAHAENLLLGRQLFARLRLSQDKLNRSFFYSFIIIYAVMLLISLGLALVMAERLAVPIRRLVSATAAVARGDWRVQITKRPGGEIGRLVDGFNRMVGRLESQRRRLIDLEKMASWREMGRHLAHEIKNPILPIQLTVQEMRDQYKGEDDGYRHMLSESVRVVEDELNHLRELVKEFSSFARMPGLSPVPGSLEDLVRDVARLYPQAEIAVDREGEVPRFPFDSDQMRRVLVNLFDNSISVLPAGEKPAVIICIASEGDAVVLTFSDNGPGIPPENKNKVFEPYFTTRRGGTGLGLAMVKSIVLLHGGTIEVSSREGEGAIFTIMLPASGPPEEGTGPERVAGESDERVPREDGRKEG